MDKPTSDNTVVEIKAFLDEKGISYNASANKSELLELVPKDDNSESIVDETDQPVIDDGILPQQPEPKPEPVRQAPVFTKAELLSLITGYMHDYFFVALKKNRTYTYAEALQAVEVWKSSGIF